MSSYRLRYLLTAPVIVVLGLSAVFMGRRGVALGNDIRRWADSLDHGSGPVRIVVPFPIYVGGDRVGSLDTVVVQRHAIHTVDSLRLVVKSVQEAKVVELSACAVRVEPLDRFDPGEYKRMLSCASDTSGLTQFGTVSFGTGHEARLYMDANDVACLRPEVVEVPAAAKAGKPKPVAHDGCKRHVTMNGADIQRIVREAQIEARSAGAQARAAAAEGRRAADAARQAARQH